MVHSTAKKRVRPARDSSRAGSKDRKRGGRQSAVKEVVWDDDARREYLTGFSKRKTAKKEAAKAKALVKEREERLELRQQLRDARKKQAANNVQMAKDYYGGEEAEDMHDPIDVDDAEDEEPKEEEYENEEMTSRVVIAEFRLSGDEDEGGNMEEDEQEEQEGDDTLLMDGPNSNMFAAIAPSRVKRTKEKEKAAALALAKAHAAAKAKAKTPFVTKNDTVAKPPPKKFTYESKAARKVESLKQKQRRMEKSDGARSRSGGKTGRGAKATGKKRGGKR